MDANNVRSQQRKEELQTLKNLCSREAEWWLGKRDRESTSLGSETSSLPLSKRPNAGSDGTSFSTQFLLPYAIPFVSNPILSRRPEGSSGVAAGGGEGSAGKSILLPGEKQAARDYNSRTKQFVKLFRK